MDSIPILLFPPSTIISILSSNSSFISSTQVPLGLDDKLALGAARGMFAVFITLLIILLLGILMPTVFPKASYCITNTALFI